jgi:nucleoside phosphorylase
MTPPPPPRDRRGFEIAIICALPLEADAVIALFDKHWEDDGQSFGSAPGDPYAYTTGVIGMHNVVVAHMPNMGTVSAAGVAASLRASFDNVKLALVVGICGGVPYGPQHDEEIFLGDVIISQSLIQYDFGRQYPNAFERKNTLEDSLGRPPLEIRSILAKLTTDHHRGRMQDSTNHFFRELQHKLRRATYPGLEADQLFEPSYLHKHHDFTICATCSEDEAQICLGALRMNCTDLGCQGHRTASRQRPVQHQSSMNTVESETLPSIHIGRMGSGDTVMKSGKHRDEIAKRDGIIAFEMEGAGVWDYFPSIVIKGVCDYADSHKNKQWQPYAAATAAACTKAFLKGWSPRIGLIEQGLSLVLMHLINSSNSHLRTLD